MDPGGKIAGVVVGDKGAIDDTRYIQFMESLIGRSIGSHWGGSVCAN